MFITYFPLIQDDQKTLKENCKKRRQFMMDDEASKSLYFRKSKIGQQCYGSWKNKHVYTFPNSLFEPITVAVASKLLSHLPKSVATSNISEEMQKQYDAKYCKNTLQAKDTDVSTNSDTSDHEWDFNQFMNERQQKTMQKLVMSLKAHSEGKKLSILQSNLCKLFGDMSGSIEAEKTKTSEQSHISVEKKSKDSRNESQENSDSSIEHSENNFNESMIEESGGNKAQPETSTKSSDSESEKTPDNVKNDGDEKKNKDGQDGIEHIDEDVANMVAKEKEAGVAEKDTHEDVADKEKEENVADTSNQDDFQDPDEMPTQAEKDHNVGEQLDHEEKGKKDKVKDKFSQYVEYKQKGNKEDDAKPDEDEEEEDEEENELSNKDLEKTEEKSDESKKRKEKSPLSAVPKRIRKKKLPFSPT